MRRERFWQRFPLEALNRDEWEALCDGCGLCCLLKLEDEDSGELYFTRMACRYLEPSGCRCSVYDSRTRHVPDCVEVTPDIARSFSWLPSSCAYRRLARGQALPAWHPLLTGDPESVHRAGISVRGRVVSEELVHEDDYEEQIVHWVVAGE